MRILEVVGKALEVPVEVLLDRSRPSDVAHARQIAIYLVHTCLHRTILDAAKIFGRDRTTGSYACARVEERREDPAFDRAIDRLEQMIAGLPEEEATRAAG
jgi:chromosomal replication initiation ATPase DnaA